MTPVIEKTETRIPWGAIACAVAGVAVFQFFGNATRGYVNTASMWWWWVSQWIDPQAETEHGWVILGIAAWLLWRNLKNGEFRMTQDERAGGNSPCVIRSSSCAAMVAGLALHGVGFVAQQTRISIVAALVFAWGVLALANRRWARAAAFPLGFMVFAIPLSVLDSLGFWLRLWVIDASTAMAHAVGIGVVRSGTQLFGPDGHYQYDVAAACSGVRSLMALAALSLLTGYLNFRSWWRRGLMLALCFPLTFLGNLARIGAIIVAAQAAGQAWGERAHDVMGFGVFGIVLGGVLGAARLVDQRWPEGKCHPLDDTPPVGGAVVQGPEPKEEGERPGGKEFHVLRETTGRWAVGVVVALAVGEMLFLAKVAAAPPSGKVGVRLTADGKDPVELPAFLGTEWIGRRAEVTAVERAILPADTGFSRRDYVSLQDRTHDVFLSIVLSGRDRTSIHRPELCLVGQGWTIAATERRRFTRPGGGGVPATVLRTERAIPGRGTVPAVVAYWFVNGDAAVATHWQRFWRDAWNRVAHGRADRWAYVLLQADARDGEAAALGRMQAVLTETLPAFQVVK